MSEAQARYKQERAKCMSGQSHQDRATCLKEAGAALNEAKRGNLGSGTGQNEQNQLKRCESFPRRSRGLPAPDARPKAPSAAASRVENLPGASDDGAAK